MGAATIEPGEVVIPAGEQIPHYDYVEIRNDIGVLSAKPYGYGDEDIFYCHILLATEPHKILRSLSLGREATDETFTYDAMTNEIHTYHLADGTILLASYWIENKPVAEILVMDEEFEEPDFDLIEFMNLSYKEAGYNGSERGC